jgi:hypothetical protein
MALAPIRRRLLLLVGAGCLWACTPTPMSEPPPRTATEVPTAADAGPPPVRLSGRGVIVPSDVKLETPPGQPPATRDPTLTGSAAGPGTN